MRVLLSTIGSRGDVQPMVALAVALNAAGYETVLCAPPDFEQWAQSLGIRYVSVGPLLRGTAKASERAANQSTAPSNLIETTIIEQFTALSEAANGGCDVVVGGGGLAIAAHSIAERFDAGYVYAAFAPVTLPSPHHRPPAVMVENIAGDGELDNAELWRIDEHRWNTRWRAPLNRQRNLCGLPDVEDVRSYLITESPWLAADPCIAPWPQPSDLHTVQTGAWLLDDQRPLAPELDEFLAAGEPPVYVGMGSGRVPAGLAQAVITAAQRVGRRVVMSRGWADLAADQDQNCLIIGEANLSVLFERVAAVVHHGGAGTTTAAAAAGVPQIVIPQIFDQPYFAERVEQLGIGIALSEDPTPTSLHTALKRLLTATARDRAQSVAPQVQRDGTQRAVQLLLDRMR